MIVNGTTQVTVPLGRGGKYGSMAVDVDRFNDTVEQHVYMYGLRQILNDAMADKTDDDGNTLPTDQIVAKVQKRLDALYAGELRVRNGSAAEPVDPVEREAYRIAREKIEEQMKSIGHWPKKGTDKFGRAVMARIVERKLDHTVESYIDTWLVANPKVMTAAKRIVAERDKADETAMV